MEDRCREISGQLAARLSSISHPIRFLIVLMLAETAMYPTEILENLGTSKGNISQHLRILLDRGLINGQKEGNKILYSVKDDKVRVLIKEIKKIYCPKFKVKIKRRNK